MVAEPGTILEVKVGSHIPYWLDALIRKYHLRRAAFSKYAWAISSGPCG
jgi:hypothetical protein